MRQTPLWLFAHRALGPQFHRDPFKLIARLGGAQAGRYVEHLWTWSLDANGADGPIAAPVIFGVERLPEGGAHLRMRFAGVASMGEPYLPCTTLGRAGAPARAQRAARRSRALVCESTPAGHRSHGAILAPYDDRGFEDEIVQVLLQDIIELADTQNDPATPRCAASCPENR